MRIADFDLPAGVELQNFGGDMLLTGPGLDQEVFKQIRSTLPPAIASRLIGWRLAAR